MKREGSNQAGGAGERERDGRRKTLVANAAPGCLIL
jgi:hypothetical protein